MRWINSSKITQYLQVIPVNAPMCRSTLSYGSYTATLIWPDIVACVHGCRRSVVHGNPGACITATPNRRSSQVHFLGDRRFGEMVIYPLRTSKTRIAKLIECQPQWSMCRYDDFCSDLSTAGIQPSGLWYVLHDHEHWESRLSKRPWDHFDQDSSIGGIKSSGDIV